MKKLLTLIIILLLIPLTLAQHHAPGQYTFAKAEELKPLINWYDYGPEAFQEAEKQNKPIFLLLTAPSWCYWCQVYESEDYLFHPQIFSYINENFIPVYVDADQRQDLTRQYLEGGWPSTTVLTPSKQRLYGFSGVRPVNNMLTNLQNAFNHVQQNKESYKINYNYEKTPQFIPSESQLNTIISNYNRITLNAFDNVNGGFGSGQKFPQSLTLDYLLELYEKTQNQDYLNTVIITLENQYTSINELETNYNLFDPVEGGFHRYGTKPDWTPPHYEKMLYDNARLLKTYSHLQTLATSDLVNEVVEKTNDYILREYYDNENGGFYANTDVHGEHEYYAKNPRPEPKARVEKTKYADWNAEAILTYLYLYDITKNTEYKQIAEKSLDFFEKEAITSSGVFHYITPDGEKGVRGSLVDNAHQLLAFTEAAKLNKDYEKTATTIADYSLENLYDWNSGGFLERNSKDKELYAPGENILLSKPPKENGVMSLAMLKLYKITNNLSYLNAGIKSFGATINRIGSLDFGYYHIQAAQFILDNDLLENFDENQETIQKTETKEQENFWINNLIAAQDLASNQGFAVSDQGIENLDGPLIILLFIALIAGLVSFASPCTLPILPAYLAYSFKSSQKNIKSLTIFFFLGLTITFTILGLTATALGSFLKQHLTTFSQIAGTLIILAGIFVLTGKSIPSIKIKNKRPTSYIGAFLFGATLGIAWTPCVGPILVAILLLASTTSSTLTGGLLLFTYAIGLSLPLIIVSSRLAKINKSGFLWKFIKGKQIEIKGENKSHFLHSTSLIAGTLFIILGILIFSGTLFQFNQYLASSAFQEFIFRIEEWLLNLA